MKRFSTIIILLVIIIAGIIAGTLLVSSTRKNPQVVQETKQVLSEKTAIPLPTQPPSRQTPGAPVSVSIPAIEIQADIEQVGLDSQGNMDVPRTHYTVAWYSLGYKPGEKGNAVLAGHLDQQNGSPAVFWNAPNLKPGDIIITTDETGKQYKFSVTRIQDNPYNNYPLNEVFGV
jgi:sortase (surface protein transpeptidase)